MENSEASTPAKPHYLSTRENWEAGANSHGASVRDATASTLRYIADAEYPGQYEIVIEPRDLDQILLEDDYAHNPSSYTKPADPEDGDIWYDTDAKMFMEKKAASKKPSRIRLGIHPDIKILHKPTKKVYFIECKAQNDAGNAHERCAKYASPSVLKAIQRKFGSEHHPIGYVFSGELVNKKKYILELQMTYRFAESHLVLWPPTRPAVTMITWFKNVIRPILC